MKHIPRKRFGQHFLSDPAIIDAIVRAIDPRPGQPMVEIGPGLAALTQPLVERLGRLTVIELDRDLAARLRAHPQLEVIESDVLKVDFAQLQQAQAATKLRVCGNLPYNISSPILFHLLPFAAHIEDQHFMLQKEVIDRMVAAPSTGDYGRLSVMLQWRYAMEFVQNDERGNWPVEQFDAKIAENKRDFDTRFAKAQALMAEGQWTASMDELLEIIMRDKKWNDEAARKTYVAILELLTPPPPKHGAGADGKSAGGIELTGKAAKQEDPQAELLSGYRRKLSMALN